MTSETTINLNLIIHVDGKMIVNQNPDGVTIDIKGMDDYGIPVINGIPYDLSSYLLVQVDTDDLPIGDADIAEELMTLGMWIGALGVAVKEDVQIHCLPFIEGENADEIFASFFDEDEGGGCDGFICDDCLRDLMDEPDFE